MAERKVVSTYYPPDFDPDAIHRTSTSAKQLVSLPTIRLAAPFPMQCITCGGYIGKGRRFNARKEDAREYFYGITIYRFYIRCPDCSSEITFKTDPQFNEYVCETGAARRTDPRRLVEETLEERLRPLEGDDQSPQDKMRQRLIMEQFEGNFADDGPAREVVNALDGLRHENALRDRVRRIATAAALEGTCLDAAALIEEQRTHEEERRDAERVRLAFRKHESEMAAESRNKPELTKADVSDGMMGFKYRPYKRVAKPERRVMRQKTKRAADKEQALAEYASASD